MIVWSLTGLWHGASWNFVMWGTYYGVLLIMEKYIYGNTLKRHPSWAQHVYAMLIVMIGWVFFSSRSFNSQPLS
jgi:alginate O-acetyltransferase complex protein AlgI